MKTCRPRRAYSSHTTDRQASMAKMKQGVLDNLARATIFRIHGLLDEMFGYQGTTEWMLTPREGLDYETPWALIVRGEGERVLAIVERLAKIGSPL